MKMPWKLKLIEQGNGIDGLSVGNVVYAAISGILLRLTSAPGCIHTDDSRGYYRIAEAVVDERDVTDLSDTEFAALSSVNVEVMP